MLTITKGFPELVEEKDYYVLKGRREINSLYPVEMEVVGDILINLDKPLYINGLKTLGNINSNVDLNILMLGKDSPHLKGFLAADGHIVCYGKITAGSVFAGGDIRSFGIHASDNLQTRGMLVISGDMISRGEIIASGAVTTNGGRMYGLKGIIVGQRGISSSGSIGSEEKIRSLGQIHSLGGGLFGSEIESLDTIRSEESIIAGKLLFGKSVSARGDIKVLNGSLLSMENIFSGGDLSVKNDIMAGIMPTDPEMKEKIPDNLDFDQIVCRKLLSGRILRGKLEEESVQDSISAGNKSKEKKQTSPSCS